MPTSPPSTGATLRVLRQLVLALVAIGLAGTAVELVLLRHYEDSWQLVPLFAIGLSLAAIAWHAIDRGPTTITILQLAMGLLIVVAATGLVLHFLSNAELQRDMDPAIGGWLLFWRSMSAQAPPGLAPGTMAQWGLLGLAYTYRLRERSDSRAPVIGGD
jgi:hypothetical protein